nr:MAG: hypothetical protein DIU61_20085 [Bacteroidota bacterium]
MKTKSSVTVHIAPLETWGQESSSYTFAVRPTGEFRAVSTYEPGDILVAGTNAKSILGLVTEVSTLPDGTQEVRIEAVTPSRPIDSLGTYLYQIIPDKFRTGWEFAEFFPTVNGAYQSILANSDVSVIIPDDAKVSSSQYRTMSWREYRATRQRAAVEARADEIREAILRLRNIVRDCPHMLERVYPIDGDTATWKFGGVSLIDHDEDDPFLSALEDLLYRPKAAPALHA